MMMGKALDAGKPNARQEGARHALLVLTAINLLNFADRYVPAAVKTLIKDDLRLSDAETAYPTMGMVLVFSVFAVLFGWAGDYQVGDRRVILCAAIAFWSVATALAGLSDDLATLVFFRSLVGVGEAAYGTIAPPLLSDFYILCERQVVYGVYYLAVPVGAALGFIIGAVVGSEAGWRVAFFVCGVPGVVVALSVLRLNDPVRGINDRELHALPPPVDPEGATFAPFHAKSSSVHAIQAEEPAPTARAEPSKDSRAYAQKLYLEFRAILTNPTFMFLTLGQAANTFALGGLAEWYATFLLRYNGATVEEAGLIAGAATIIGGVVGTILGSKIADHLDGKVRSAYLLVPALFCIPATVCNIWAVNVVGNSGAAYTAIFFTQVFAWTQTGPISAVSISCIPPHLRARASGIIILIIHFLGDVISPPIIGAISDATGSLQAGLQCTWIAMAVGGCWWAWAALYLKPLSYAQADSAGAAVTFCDVLSK